MQFTKQDTQMQSEVRDALYETKIAFFKELLLPLQKYKK